MQINEFTHRPARWRTVAALTAAAAIVVAAGCGSGPAQETAPAETVEHADHGDEGLPRVFFVQPEDGATLKSPVHFEFAVDHFEVVPVPEGAVEHARAGMGHHHLGVDTTCLPPGTLIEKAEPWIHFGKGDNTIEMQLTPGPHTFALQIGDDQHHTIEGLCQTITLTVEE